MKFHWLLALLTTGLALAACDQVEINIEGPATPRPVVLVASTPLPPTQPPTLAPTLTTVAPTDLPPVTATSALNVNWNQPQPPTFADFPVIEIFSSAPAEVNLASHPGAAMFESQLREQVALGPNFSGHYTVVEFGCGSNCQAHLLVDSQNGQVFDGVPSERGLLMTLNSNLLIADPPYPTTMNVLPDNPSALRPVRYFVWNGTRLTLVYEVACTVIHQQHQCQ